MTHTQSPRIRHIANLWTLWDHPGTGSKEWSIDRKLSAIKEAGFDGIGAQLDAELGAKAQKQGLCAVGYFASSKPSEFRDLIRRNQDGGALRINVQLADHDTPVDKAISMAVRIVEEGDRLGIPCDIEVHRDTCTETPEKTYAIAAGFKKATGRLMPMTWDFSHLSVVKHLAPPYADRLLVDAKLIQHARQFHFRPFNGNHCQIPVTNGAGKLSLEFNQWVPFLERTLEVFFAGKLTSDDVIVCPEMGPVRGGYNFAQLPSSWEDAKVLREIIDKTWKKILRQSVPS